MSESDIRYSYWTEVDDEAVTLKVCVRNVSLLKSPPGHRPSLQSYCGLLKSFQENIRMIPPSGHGRFLSNPLRFIIRQSSYYCRHLQSASVVK